MDTARVLARFGPFLAGDQPVLVETNVPSFADLVVDRLRDLRGEDARREVTVLTVERAPQTWLTAAVGAPPRRRAGRCTRA